MSVGRAPGKLILCGEHAVVYGHPAIAIAVGLFTEVEVTPCRRVEAEGDDRLREALSALAPQGGRFSIRSELPMGAGMGSSASLAVAAVRALGSALTLEEELEQAMRAERVFHGSPSGLDAAVIARGGALRFQRGAPPAMTPLPPPSWTGVVLDTGVPGDTRAMVAQVARGAHGPLLAEIGSIADAIGDHLDNIGLLGPLLTHNHALLRALGVSTPHLDHLVGEALALGATGAKLCGAGGGGVALALHPDPAALRDALRARGHRAMLVRPPQERQ
ncbi:MAG: hypothetical protein JXX28_05795 [Deltaproteobacteria bacterium]|nr:hypothetical protein [Deltaproteobacteria bacterium]